jgi:hypothetical protein
MMKLAAVKGQKRSRDNSLFEMSIFWPIPRRAGQSPLGQMIAVRALQRCDPGTARVFRP